MTARPSSPRIIFVNRFYWPSETATAQLLTDLSEELSRQGCSVAVITSRTAGAARLPAREIRGGVEIHRVRATRWGYRSAAGKAVDFSTFTLGALGRMHHLVRAGDTLVLLTDPPLLGAWATPLARRRGARVIHWLQDIYPEVALALASNPLVRAGLRGFRPLRNAAWRRANACVALGSDMAAFVAENKVPAEKIRVIPNWAPLGLGPLPPSAAAELRQAWGLEGKFVVAYSGNLGRVHALAPILALAGRLRGDTSLVFAFIGGGPRLAGLRADARARKLPNVRFFPAQPRYQLARTLALGDLHLVTLRDECASFVFPSKLAGIAAAGRPVLFLGPPGGEITRLIRAHSLGLALATGEAAAAAAALQRLRADPARLDAMRAAAVQFHRHSGGFPAAVRAWRELLGDSAAAKPLAGAATGSS